MAWSDVGKGEGGSGLPILKIDKPTRIRIIGPKSAPDVAGYELFEEGALQAYTHWAPEAVQELIGGPRSIPCITVKGGCIFHEAPLDWKASKGNYVNVVVYEGYDVKKKTFDSRKVLVLQGGVTIFQQLRDQAFAADLTPDEADFTISKTGKGLSTVYTVTLGRENLEATIDLSDLPEQQPDFADENFPMLIDIKKFDAFKVGVTPASQREWYDALMTPAEESAESTALPADPDGAPEKKKPGRPAKDKIALAPPGAKPKPAPAAAAKPAEKPVVVKKTVPNPDHALYVAALAISVPWDEDQTLASDSEAVDLIIETGVNTEYEITQEILDAAMTVKAGEPDETIEVEEVAAKPKPGAAKPTVTAPGAKPKPAPAAAAKPAGPNIEELQEKLTGLRKASVLLKKFPVMQKFMAEVLGGAKTIGSVTDADLLLEGIALLEAGDEAITEHLGIE